MAENRLVRCAIAVTSAAAVAVAIWAFVRYVAVWLSPFIAAVVLARAIEPGVRFLQRRAKMPRGAASGLCTAVVFVVAVTLVVLAVGRILYELSALARDLPKLPGELPRLLAAPNMRLREMLDAAPVEVRELLTRAADEAWSRGAALIAEVLRGALSAAGAIASGGPRILLFVLTCALGTFYISSGYDEFRSFFLRQIPQTRRRELCGVFTDFRQTTWKMVRVQLILLAVTMAQLLILFCMLRIKFAIVPALLVAAVDLLPIVGTGIVLVPWGIIELVGGTAARGIALLAVCALIGTVRRIAEPKLVSSQLGLPPIASIAAMYIGFRVGGVVVMALAPLALMMVVYLNRCGYIKLWK